MRNTQPTTEETLLRERAHDVIQVGRLPTRRPDRTWGGPGVGTLCAVCARPITLAQMEMEVGFSRNGPVPGLDTYRLHLSCFAAWEFERVKVESTPP